MRASRGRGAEVKGEEGGLFGCCCCWDWDWEVCVVVVAVVVWVGWDAAGCWVLWGVWEALTGTPLV